MGALGPSLGVLTPPPFEPYAAGSSGNKRCHIRGGVGLVDGAREKSKARAVAEIHMNRG